MMDSANVLKATRTTIVRPSVPTAVVRRVHVSMEPAYASAVLPEPIAPYLQPVQAMETMATHKAFVCVTPVSEAHNARSHSSAQTPPAAITDDVILEHVTVKGDSVELSARSPQQSVLPANKRVQLAID